MASMRLRYFSLLAQRMCERPIEWLDFRPSSCSIWPGKRSKQIQEDANSLAHPRHDFGMHQRAEDDGLHAGFSALRSMRRAASSSFCRVSTKGSRICAEVHVPSELGQYRVAEGLGVVMPVLSETDVNGPFERVCLSYVKIPTWLEGRQTPGSGTIRPR